MDIKRLANDEDYDRLISHGKQTVIFLLLAAVTIIVTGILTK